MENLGSTFLMVINPPDFDIKQLKVLHSDFGFVISSQSRFFRDSIIKLCEEYHDIRKMNFGKNFITNTRNCMKKYVNKQGKTERDLFELVVLLFDISYYTAISHDKDAYLRKFSIIEGGTLKCLGYIGSQDFSTSEVIGKIQEKIKSPKYNNRTGSCFEVYQLNN